MKIVTRLVAIVIAAAGMTSFSNAQTSSSTLGAVVPRLVNFSGKAADTQGKAFSGVVGVTFAIYKDQDGGSPLWLESQNVQADAKGNYTAQLGATKPDGLPLDLFTSGEARWLGVTVNGGQEQSRILLLSVPYALKAADAETVGGLPPSAFVLAAPTASTVTAPASTTSRPESTSNAAPPPATTITGAGTAGFLPDFTGTSTVGNSAVFQSGSAPTAKIGINTNAPTAALDVRGTASIRGSLNLPPSGIATALGGKNSEPLNVAASTFNNGLNAAVTQTFQLKAEAANNNSNAPSATLNLLFGQGASVPTETGLKIDSTGHITFANGQIFPGTGKGTLTSISGGTGLTGGTITTSGTLAIDSTVVPRLSSANAFTNANSISVNNSTTALTVTNSGAGVGVTGSSGSFIGVSGSGGFAGVSGTGITYGVQGTGGTIGGAFSVSGSSALYASDSENDGDCDFCAGVFGLADNSAATHRNMGVYGQSKSNVGAGVYGLFGPQSINGATQLEARWAGVWADSASATALVATSDGAPAIAALSSNKLQSTVEAYNFGGGFALDAGNGFSSHCLIDIEGNLACSGTKSAFVPVDRGSRKVKLYAVEAAQNWFEDAGSAELSGGEAVVQLDPLFAQTVNTIADYHVFLTPNGDCRGLYVARKTATEFTVRELGRGTSTLSFDYRIMAKRKGYEDVRLATAQEPIRNRVPAMKAANPMGSKELK